MDTAAELRTARVPAVLITLAAVRGHAPREAGAKMIATADDLFGTIGGGNLEMTALTRARELLAERQATPEMLTLRLNDKAPAKYGR
ncbi:MAG TPA: xanthine dehydrogenase accessory protein XdhC, partial [Brevibacterium sp.]|nr:xanthine dehydrogenase accessory protein XdhC [Brevibacterium sp.]